MLTHTALRTLVWLSLQEADDVRIPDEICHSEEQGEIGSELAKAGYVVNEPSPGGVRLGFIGNKKTVAKRKKAKFRKDAAQVRLLQWLDDNPGADTMDVLATPLAEDFPGALGRDEFDEAGKWLLEHGFIRGERRWGPGLSKARLTAEGIEAVSSPFAPGDLDQKVGGQPMTTYNTHVEGPVGSMQQGSRNTATVHQQHNNTALDEALTLLGELRTVVDQASVDDSKRAFAKAQVDSLEAQVRDGGGKTTGTMFLGAAESALGTGLGEGLKALFGELSRKLLALLS